MASRRVFALVRDVMFRSRIRQALPADDWEIVAVATVDGLESALDGGAPDLVLVDLASRGLPWELLVITVRERLGSTVPVLAFGPHMDLGLRGRALAAGADRVVANSTLVTELPVLARKLVAAKPRVD